MDNRTQLRKKLRQQRVHQTGHGQAIASQIITERLIRGDIFQKSHHIAVYMSIDYEINPEQIAKKAWEYHKRCYLPIVQGRELIFSIYESNTPLKKNRWAIPEPLLSPEGVINPRDLDLVLVPLLAFTVKGERLGRGGGFYDKSFHFLLQKPRPIKPFLIGLAYEWQRLDALATQHWDVPLNTVLTEERDYVSIEGVWPFS